MKICFWGNIAGALEGKTAGGGELQQALLAKSLAKGGNEVVVLDINTTENWVTDDGIKVCKIDGWNNSKWILRVINRIPNLYRSLKAQKADIYYCRIRDFRHIFAYWAARKSKAKFILGIASDLDVMNYSMRWKKSHFDHFSSIWSFVNGIIIEVVYPFLLKKADLVLVQHEGQRNILLNKGIKSLVFPNLFSSIEHPIIKTNNSHDYIYVGWLDMRKGFKEFYELVKQAPYHSFKVIGPTRDKIASIIYDELKGYKNVKLLGKLSHTETLHHIANSKALISTSHMEGFPNVFIEAWACGVPVLSLYVDPGNILEKESLGEFAGGSMDKLLQSLDRCLKSDDFSIRSKNYITNNHILNAKKNREINQLFESLS